MIILFGGDENLSNGSQVGCVMMSMLLLWQSTTSCPSTWSVITHRVLVILSVRSLLGIGEFELYRMATLDWLVHWDTRGIHSLPRKMQRLQEDMPSLKTYPFLALLEGKQAIV